MHRLRHFTLLLGWLALLGLVVPAAHGADGDPATNISYSKGFYRSRAFKLCDGKTVVDDNNPCAVFDLQEKGGGSAEWLVFAIDHADSNCSATPTFTISVADKAVLTAEDVSAEVGGPLITGGVVEIRVEGPQRRFLHTIASSLTGCGNEGVTLHLHLYERRD